MTKFRGAGAGNYIPNYRNFTLDLNFNIKYLF